MRFFPPLYWFFKKTHEDCLLLPAPADDDIFTVCFDIFRVSFSAIWRYALRLYKKVNGLLQQ